MVLLFTMALTVWSISHHFLNNNLGVTIYGSTGGLDFVFSWKSILLNSICFSLIYLSFLFSKEYNEAKISPSLQVADTNYNTQERVQIPHLNNGLWKWFCCFKELRMLCNKEIINYIGGSGNERDEKEMLEINDTI